MGDDPVGALWKCWAGEVEGSKEGAPEDPGDGWGMILWASSRSLGLGKRRAPRRGLQRILGTVGGGSWMGPRDRAR